MFAPSSKPFIPLFCPTHPQPVPLFLCITRLERKYSQPSKTLLLLWLTDESQSSVVAKVVTFPTSMQSLVDEKSNCMWHYHCKVDKYFQIADSNLIHHCLSLILRWYEGLANKGCNVRGRGRKWRLASSSSILAKINFSLSGCVQSKLTEGRTPESILLVKAHCQIKWEE